VFLTARRAVAHRVPAAADLDPASGRARLSYEMAEQLFKRYTGGKTLHQLRHSRLTHLGDGHARQRLGCGGPRLVRFADGGSWLAGSGSGTCAWIWWRLRRPSFCLIT
jgi:hypothetical protein